MSAYQLGGGLREKYGREYQSVPGGTDPAFQRAFRLRDGFCRSDLLCGNCSAAADEESSETAKPILVIPACFLGGAVFCLFCDLIARTVFAPTELSISSVTAVFGAPVVIYVMINRKRG